MKRTILGSVAGLVLGAGMAASGVTLQYSFTQEFSGGQAPAGPTPWVRLTATDVGQVAGTVSLTIDNLGLTGGENMAALYFNYDDGQNLGDLTFAFGDTTGDFEFPEITLDANGLKADGDGFFDILLEFATGGVDDSVFGDGETLELLISSTDGVTPVDFAFLSAPAGGHGPFAAAAHIQNTTGAGTGGSGWIAGTVGGPFGPPPPPPPPPVGVPDAGGTLGLLGVGLITLGAVGRRCRR